MMMLIFGLVACLPEQSEVCSSLSEYGIELKCPEQWRVQEVGVDSPLLLNSFEIVTLSPIINKTRQEDVTIKVLVESLPQAMSVDEVYQDIALKKLESYGTTRLGIYGNKILKKKPFIFADVGAGYQIVYSRFDGKNKVKGAIFFRLRVEPKDTRTYIIHYSAQIDKYDEFFSTVEDFARSMQPLTD